MNKFTESAIEKFAIKLLKKQGCQHIYALSTGELQFAPTDKIAPNGSIWQRNYYEHIIRNNKSYLQISEYIKHNPLNWEKDKYFE